MVTRSTIETQLGSAGRYWEVDMKINGSSNKWYDMRATNVQRRQEGFIDAPDVPNAGTTVYGEVEHLGYNNPTWIVEGTFDDTQGEQWLLANSGADGANTIRIADGTKFTAGDSAYLYDSSYDEEVTISSITATVAIAGGIKEIRYYVLVLTGEGGGGALANSYTTDCDAKLRSRKKISVSTLKEFIEEDTDKVLRDPILAPNGICVQITDLEINKSSESNVPTAQVTPSTNQADSSTILLRQGAMLSYTMTCKQTNNAVA